MLGDILSVSSQHEKGVSYLKDFEGLPIQGLYGGSKGLLASVGNEKELFQVTQTEEESSFILPCSKIQDVAMGEHFSVLCTVEGEVMVIGEGFCLFSFSSVSFFFHMLLSFFLSLSFR